VLPLAVAVPPVTVVVLHHRAVIVPHVAVLPRAVVVPPVAVVVLRRRVPRRPRFDVSADE